jgi:hypothetical protein
MFIKQIKFIPVLMVSLMVLAACDTTSLSGTSSSNSSQASIQHTITFKNYDDSVLSTQTVNQGANAVYSGPTPTKPSTEQYTYTFTGWDKTLTNITTSFSTTAQYSQTTKTFTITWQNHDGTVLETDNNVPYGTKPTFNGVTPSKLSVEDYDFTFNGWSPEVTSVVGNATYTAQFTQTFNFIPITTAQELNNIRNNLSGKYRLMNDIDLESNEWTPIGTDTAPFTGTLDGKDFTINNLKITTSQVYVGLIGYNEGTIINLKLDNVDINVTGSLSSNIYGGAFIGYNNSDSEIENLHTLNGDTYLKKRGDYYGYSGGLIGYQNKQIKIKKSSNKLNVFGDLTESNGGIVGFSNSNLEFEQIRNFGEISSTIYFTKTGGLVGFVSSGSIIKSSNQGFINGVNGVGGLVGQVLNSIEIINSFNSGNLQASGGTSGGLLAYSVFAQITILSSINFGSISGGSLLGGLVGQNNGSINISKSFNLGDISGTSTLGGLIAIGYTINVNQSFNSGSINGDYNIAGLVSYITDSITIENSYNEGVIIGKTNTVGGLVALGTGPLTLLNSFNRGPINGLFQSGGLVARSNHSIYVYYSVNFGDVIANRNTLEIGSITSTLPSNNDIEDTYYSGTITANGLEVDGIAFGTKVTDLSTFNLAFFTTTLEWDTEIWDFTGLDIANGVYPTLRNMPEIRVEE